MNNKILFIAFEKINEMIVLNKNFEIKIILPIKYIKLKNRNDIGNSWGSGKDG